ncbi:adenine phosphoribosyltransferase [Yersinia ruckeri]|uniref:Adenine phosphoribosyltransferase n=1 Tax=Yersinia ruckeri TaxID=29486 RepID=A0A085U6Y1_YERRU|nr:phosphoribosyltransferase family protein [Yersinia ruckeri]AKA38901.1 adenine phosphoribosyltransferase [Yersinia ruckeri]ARY99554.1 adenine phosphoribosyltransferase [Yersinia ruckeri]AUQ41720.1 adenine phosphoribosyltransferase [Yersinia ruckeri]EEQ00005.1 Phosphoribosyl transferase protein [Yersinia ruckeri ATCC 29473]EKN3345841.1 adenine phosphoribosyltransferase [Yersinia ruckeri]
MLLEEVYNNAQIVYSGRHLTTVNEFTDQLPALRPELLIEVAYRIIKTMDLTIDKIVTEEDKGAPLATAISIFTGIPLAMARWYPYSLDDITTHKVNLQSEYFEGSLYLNGICHGDRVAIIDDTLSTGGTAISLVESIRHFGGEVTGIFCAVEKVQQNGRNHVLEKTGITVNSTLKISIDKNKVTIVKE